MEWLFGTMCGIRPDGENRFRIEPVPGGHFTHAEASYRSRFGAVSSGWEKTDEGWAFTVTVPANCTADVRLPDGTAFTQTAGTKIYRTARG